ncbi:MAG: DUF3047 domain-containing protein [Lentisphaeria bacterium]|nr:DUF3047 domain-containing protein [Lentisphaeria bacterium]
MKYFAIGQIFFLLACLAAPLHGEESPQKSAAVGWRCDFTATAKRNWPPDWGFRAGKVLVPETRFRVTSAEDGSTVLLVEAKHSTGMLMTMPKVSIEKYPILRWRWRVRNLPPEKDAKGKPVDEQAAAIYFGMRAPLEFKSLSYRWETETQKGHEKDFSYGAGTVRVRSFCMRNQETPLNEWQIEERNVAEDFRRAFGANPPDHYVIGVGANSQYTDSHTFAEIDWIELKQPEKKAVQTAELEDKK